MSDKRQNLRDALAVMLHDIETRAGREVLARGTGIEALALDVDGVMTDGTLLQGDDGQEQKGFHARDGFGLHLLARTPLKLAIITGRESAVVEKRAREIGAHSVLQGCHDKRTGLEQVCRDLDVPPEQLAYMGDDVIDLPAMHMAGLALCPADAHRLVIASADWISERDAGNAALRDALELLLHARGELVDALDDYLPR